MNTGSLSHSAPLVITGPTSVGKSQVALLVAERLNGEIVSVDAMQVYCGLDIGTDKPSAADRARVRHHLLDVASLSEGFDAAKFVRLATVAVKGIQRRRHVPVLCGGSGLYFRALFHGLGDAPVGETCWRAELGAMPLDRLLDELETADPVMFGRIDRHNPRRVIRALEIIRATGCRASALRSRWHPEGELAVPAVGLSRERSALRRRISERVEGMFNAGLVEETQALLKRGLATNRTAMQAIGYRQVADYLQGVRSLAETIELVKRRTRQLAKRQMTWFRRQMRLHWIEWEPGWPTEKVADRIAGYYRAETATDPNCRSEPAPRALLCNEPDDQAGEGAL